MLKKLKEAIKGILNGTTRVLPIVSEFPTVPGANVVLEVLKGIQDACNETDVQKVSCITTSVQPSWNVHLKL